MSAPWMKFYPRDWRGDQALRAVSIAARGFWMECLCIMHEAKPYGHLVLNGLSVEGDTLARMTGVSVDEVSALLAELRQAGVLSVTNKGVVFSRRMVADHARANKGRNAVKKRWSQTAVKTQENSEPNRSANSSPTTQKPEARYSEANASDAGASAPAYPVDPVERLWAEGVDLMSLMGQSSARARPLIGRWLKEARNDAGRVLDAIRRAHEHGTKDPAALVARILNPINREKPNETSLSAHARNLTERIEASQRGEPLFAIGGEPSGGNPVRMLSHGGRG